MKPQTYLGDAPKFNGSASLVADSPVGIVLRYIGSEASATVTVDATGITLKHGDAAAEAVDSTVGTAGVVADAVYTTLGAMIDEINSSPNWRAELVDALRADASANTLKALSEYTFAPKTEQVQLYMDTSASLSLSYLISARRGNFQKSQKGKQSMFHRAYALVNIGSGALTLTVLDVDPAHGTTKTLATFAGTDDTQLDTGEFAEPLRSEYGHELLVRYTGSGDLPDSGAYLRVQGSVQ